MAELLASQKIALTLLSNFGCIEENLLAEIISSNDPRGGYRDITYLINHKLCKRKKQHYIIPYTFNNMNMPAKYEEKSNGLWVAAQILKDKTGRISEENARNIQIGETSDSLSFIKDNKTEYLLFSLTNKSPVDGAVIKQQVRKVLKGKPENYKFLKIIIVVRSEDMLDYLEELDFDFKHIVAVVTYPDRKNDDSIGEFNRPTVTFYQ